MKTDTPALKQRKPYEIETSVRLHLEWFVCSECIVRSECLKGNRRAIGLGIRDRTMRVTALRITTRRFRKNIFFARWLLKRYERSLGSTEGPQPARSDNQHITGNAIRPQTCF